MFVRAGLGNQMFEYATARALCLRIKADLFLLPYGYEDGGRNRYELFRYNIVAFTDNNLLPSNPGKVYREQLSFNYLMPEILDITSSDENVTLFGFFQQTWYFSDYADQIRSELTLKDPLSSESQIWANRIKSDSCPVSLHVRRGDYLNEDVRKYFDLLPKEYYHKAVGLLKENFPDMSLYIFSDDIPWCRSHLNFTVPTHFIDCNDELHGYEDLELMKLCQHHIIANSTFSWWAAWLDDKIGSVTISPRKMFLYYRPKFDYYRFEPRWITLNY